MGQQQTTITSASKKTTFKNSVPKEPIYYKALSLDDSSILRPNGYFPPEIIVLILKYANILTCVRSSQSCKLWYESLQEVFKNIYMSRYGPSESLEDNWKVNLHRRLVMDQNLTNGMWWAEALSSFHYPNYHTFSYVASFEGNKVIFNNHHIHMSSNANEKFFESAYQLDLDTMERESIPYGTIFANGFKLKTWVINDYDHLNWKEFEVSDGTTTRTIERTFPVPNAETMTLLYFYYGLYVNMDGSSTVLTTNELKNHRHVHAKYIEVVDLATGNVIAQLKTPAKKVLGLIGNTVIVHLDKDISLIDILTNERKILEGDGLGAEFHYCKETKLLAYCVQNEGIIRFYSWPNMDLVWVLDVKQKLPPSNDDARKDKFMVRGFAFDKSKVVVAISTETPFFSVFDIQTGVLIQTFYNTSDGYDCFGAIHLAPNGKIVTDFHNLTVYDFASSKIYQQIPVIFAKVKVNKGMISSTTSAKIIKKKIAAIALSNFAARKLGTPIQHHTFFKQDNEGRQYRLTGIASHNNDRQDWKKFEEIDWIQLSTYVAAWEDDNEVRNTFQITHSDFPYPKDSSTLNHFITWNRLRKVIFVYEQFNAEKNQWEFAEPIGLENLLDKNASVIEK